MSRLAAIALLFAVALAPRVGLAQQPSAFLILRGADTLVVNRVTWSGDTVRTSTMVRGGPRVELTATFAGDTMRAGTLRVFAPGANPDAAPVQRGTITVRRDSAVFDLDVNGQARRLARPVPADVVAQLNNDFALTERAMMRVRALGADSVRLTLLALGGVATLPADFLRVGADSIRMKVAGQDAVYEVDARGRITGGRIAAPGLTVSRVDGAAVAGIAFGRPDYGAPAGAPYRAEEVTVRTPAGHVLTGTLTLPPNAGARVPAVVTITGSGHQDRDEFIGVANGFRLFRQVADTLGRRGIAVLRLDDRGINGSGGDVNGTSADFADDIRAGIAFLRSRAEIDPARIGVVGHSEGGIIGPMVAASDPRIAAVAIMAGPAHTGRRIIDFQLRQAVESDTSIAAAKRDSALHAVIAQFDSSSGAQPWMRYFLAYDPVPTLRRVKQPVLVLHGATDRQVTVDQVPLIEQALRAGGNRRVTTRIFPDRNHLFLRDPSGLPIGYAKLTDGRVDAEVMGALADWLAATLGADGIPVRKP